MQQSRAPFVIGAVIVGLLVGLGLLALATTGSGEPPAPAPPPPPSASPTPSNGSATAVPAPADVLGDEGTTVVRFEIDGSCEGCLVAAVPANGQQRGQGWEATIAGGSADLEAPTPDTYGLAILLAADEDARRKPVPLNADSAAPGVIATAAEVAGAESIGYCWAGTTVDTVILQLTKAGTQAPGVPAFANPALAVVGDAVPTGSKVPADLGCGGLS